MPAGTAFPVKVLFAFEGGPPDVTPQDTQALTAAMTDVAKLSNTEDISFALVGFHAAGDALLGNFSNAGTFQQAITQFPAYQPTGPVSISEAPRARERPPPQGDMATSCKGSLARTRYVVVLAFTSQDSTCSNKVFEDLVDPSGCGTSAAPTDAGVGACVACHLTYDTLALKQLAVTYNVGELDVIPVYYTDAGPPDPDRRGRRMQLAIESRRRHHRPRARV